MVLILASPDRGSCCIAAGSEAPSLRGAMPYNPNIAGSWGRSHSQGKQWQPKGVIYKARGDDVAMSRSCHMRAEGSIGCVCSVLRNTHGVLQAFERASQGVFWQGSDPTTFLKSSSET